MDVAIYDISIRISYYLKDDGNHGDFYPEDNIYGLRMLFEPTNIPLKNINLKRIIFL